MAIISRPEVPFIPENITVHLGAPDQPAENVTLPFPSYIKNVASSEIYPTWPESAIRANIYAQISYALNRVYTEWYRSQGYDFDITNSTQYDHAFVKNREIYDNISRIVDEIFNSYVVKQGNVQPFFTAYCDGKTTTCKGLSQWGSVDLAQQGLNPYEILQHYYGNDINILTDAPVGRNFESYPLAPLQLGSFGRDVSIIQNELNRIRENYPTIPKISVVDGIFSAETEAAVKAFQKIFNLTQDGIVGSATWYKIKYIYNGVKGLGELFSEGITPEELERPFDVVWKEGDTGVWVKLIQYYVRALTCYYNLPRIKVTGYFNPDTTQAVKQLEEIYGITVDGEVGIDTWAKFYKDYKLNYNRIPKDCFNLTPPYPGYLIYRGMGDKNVRLIQTYLQKISQYNPNIPRIEVTGIFDKATEDAVKAFDKEYLGEGTGVIGPITWDKIIEIYESLPVR